MKKVTIATQTVSSDNEVVWVPIVEEEKPSPDVVTSIEELTNPTV